MGHGEWTQLEGEGIADYDRQLDREPEWVYKWLSQHDPDINRHKQVIEQGYPNRWGARIPVESTWNLELFEYLLAGYHDAEVVECLKYGWPTGRLPSLPDPHTAAKNHKGALDYPEQLQRYIKKEARYGAVMGPYNKIPFNSKVGISPLSSRPKKGSEDRRVILDLSFPLGEAVNDGIPKDSYMGFQAKLEFP